MIKYSATDMCGSGGWMFAIWGYGYMWIINLNVCWQSYCRIYAGTNEIMKIVIARGLFKDLLRKGKKF
jgi:acyl-CoA dehydrogenase